jgi:tryptophanyl-tRNA synthetase
MSAFKELVFSGVQPTGNLHLGNYLGAIKRFVEMQARDAQCLYCVVDMHAITLWQDPAALKGQIREVTAAFLAAGINRMTQFKDKAGKDRENASVGLYAYPVLMAADILAYRATHVPVGEDQKQHLELTRDIAQKFNNDFSDSIAAHGHDAGDGFFPVTEPLIGGPAARVMSLRDGTKKMSKSDASDNSRINLTDDADAIAAKVRKAKTDPDALPSEVAGLAGRPEADNLVGIFAALKDVSREDVLRDFGGAQFSAFKGALVELAVETLAPLGAEMKRLVADPAEIDAVLADGAERAEAIAAPTLDAVKDIVGFVRRGPRLHAVR